MAGIVQRHQDYQLTVASVPVGGGEYPLTLDTDAPFMLRLVRSRNIGLSGWKFQTPRKLWQSSALRTDWIPGASPGAGPFPSRGSIIYEELVYPSGSQIVCIIGNQTAAPLTNARLLFRGSKLFAEGSIVAPSYPPSLSPLPFVYQVPVLQVPISQPVALQQQLQIRSDADFAIRYGACDPFFLGVEGGPVGTAFVNAATQITQGNFTEVYAMLRDESKRAYSNEPIHVNDLFGQGLPSPTGAGANDGPVAFTPGLYTPEIYVERDHSLYFDVTRADTSGQPLNLYFRFCGIKVFKR